MLLMIPPRFLSIVLACAALQISSDPAPAGLIEKDAALAAQKFWDNRDFAWYKDNIPFFDCPDAELVTTYYYRWELITKHLTYGSPNSGYSFTEFIDRPFWSGTYGAISCPAGHQFYELRWLRDATYIEDYAKYWFRTPGAQPRNYGTWLADGIWAAHAVHPNDELMKSLLPDLKVNYEAWEKRQFVPEVGLFWQNGHDDGMEFNINSRQTTDILRGANGYRPGFNAYMWADALAIARCAKLAGDDATAKAYEQKASGLKEKLQKLLWDPTREFFFPMSMKEEKDKEGNVVKKHTLTYQSGKFAGSPHGREEHAYIPWQFNLPDADKGYEVAWKFLMDPQYFYATYGPSTVERNDPMFLLQKGCCWWSGQSWPYSTAQTLKAMANLLQNYPQKVVTKEDYYKLLHIFAISHRKEGQPYLAEALHPDTGSFEGHDAFNHSEHYFHSSFNDLVITGLMGLKTDKAGSLEIDPLVPVEWSYFAIDDVPYAGHLISLSYDRDGSHYKQGVGMKLWVDGKVVAEKPTIEKLAIALPAKAPAAKPAKRLNYAVNNDGDHYPNLTASFTAPDSSLAKVNDGNCFYTTRPVNRWTTLNSPNPQDWIEVDFGAERKLDCIHLAFLDDGKGIVAPQKYEIQIPHGAAWESLPEQKHTPAEPTGHLMNRVTFPEQALKKFRVLLTHAPGGFSGLTELEAWGIGSLPYVPVPPQPGNLAYNPTRQGFPKATASFHDVYGGVPTSATDGRKSYQPNPVNRWTSYGSPNAQDWLEVDFGEAKEVRRVELYIYDDKGGVQPPTSYTVQSYTGTEWQDIANQKKNPALPAGSAQNTVTFDSVTTSKLRVLFTNRDKARSGLTELEIFGAPSASP